MSKDIGTLIKQKDELTGLYNYILGIRLNKESYEDISQLNFMSQDFPVHNSLTPIQGAKLKRNKLIKPSITTVKFDKNTYKHNLTWLDNRVPTMSVHSLLLPSIQQWASGMYNLIKKKKFYFRDASIVSVPLKLSKNNNINGEFFLYKNRHYVFCWISQSPQFADKCLKC